MNNLRMMATLQIPCGRWSRHKQSEEDGQKNNLRKMVSRVSSAAIWRSGLFEIRPELLLCTTNLETARFQNVDTRVYNSLSGTNLQVGE